MKVDERGDKNPLHVFVLPVVCKDLGNNGE